MAVAKAVVMAMAKIVVMAMVMAVVITGGKGRNNGR